jgi:hypothetical protein
MMACILHNSDRLSRLGREGSDEMARVRRSQRRKAVRRFVETRDLEGLVEWAKREPDTVFLVVAMVFERDDLGRWRAIDTLGRLSAHIAEEEGLEKVRGIIRRLLWLMNDESGGIAWHGPEAIAEVLKNVPALLDEYGRIIASAIDEPPFGPGAHRAAAMLASMAPEQFQHIRQHLEEAHRSEDPVERAYGTLALAALSLRKARFAAEALQKDRALVHEYDPSSDELRERTVGEVVRPLRESSARAA